MCRIARFSCRFCTGNQCIWNYLMKIPSWLIRWLQSSLVISRISCIFSILKQSWKHWLEFPQSHWKDWCRFDEGASEQFCYFYSQLLSQHGLYNFESWFLKIFCLKYSDCTFLAAGNAFRSKSHQHCDGLGSLLVFCYPQKMTNWAKVSKTLHNL